jgi:ABC-2 type transport system permease protein
LNVKTLYYLIEHDWKDFGRNLILWVMVALPVMLSFFIVRATATPATSPADILPTWVLFAQANISIMLTVLNFVQEKEKRTLEALLLTPASYTGIVLAKAIFVFVLCVLAQLLVLLVNGGLIGNLAALFGMIALGALIFVSVGLLVALLSETERNGSALASVVMVLSFLSGVVYQAFGPLQEVLRFLPSVLSVRLVGAALRDQPFDPVELGVQLGWPVLLLLLVGLAIWRELHK